MSNKVFGSILAVILIGVIAVSVVLVGGKMGEYSELTKRLDGRVKSLGKFAGLSPEEMPSESIVEKRRSAHAEWNRGVEAARKQHTDREEKFAQAVRSFGGNRSGWIAAYRDAFADLSARYREATGLAADAPLPFAELEEPDPSLDLALAEKAWRVQSLLIEGVLAAGGEVRSYVPQAKRAVDQQNKEDPRTNFTLDQVELKAELPPAKLSEFLDSILGHPELTLEVADLVVGKDPDHLVYDLIQEDKVALAAEPDAVLMLKVNILTWKPAPPPEEE